MKNAKKVLAILFALVFTIGCLTACSVEAESIVLSNTTMTVNIGNAQAVTAEVMPEDTSDKTIEWSSSNPAVATVNNVGVITGVSTGTCTITATCGEASATLTVTVKKPVEQVVLNKSEVTIKEEETFTFTCTIVPNDASEKNVSWTSSDSSVATVNASGTITGIKAGTCTITATCDGKVATANITVKEKGPDFKKLYNELDSDVKYGFKLASDGSYLSADTNVYNLDDYSNWSIWDAIVELQEKMGLPASLEEDMNNTTWSMGKQQETFEDIGVKVSWTYHPDKGMEITYKLINP